MFFFEFMLISKKKKKFFRLSSATFLRHIRARRREPQLSTVFGEKQKRRFLAGEKMPKFAKF